MVDDDFWRGPWNGGMKKRRVKDEVDEVSL
jgi:hypothetical protein